MVPRSCFLKHVPYTPELLLKLETSSDDWTRNSIPSYWYCSICCHRTIGNVTAKQLGLVPFLATILSLYSHNLWVVPTRKQLFHCTKLVSMDCTYHTYSDLLLHTFVLGSNHPWCIWHYEAMLLLLLEKIKSTRNIKSRELDTRSKLRK